MKAPKESAAVPASASAVGFPQDAGPHDKTSLIEWWYFNSIITTAGKHHYAVVGSFFRTGLGAAKGHYLIYSLTDLDNSISTSYSVLDPAEAHLMALYLAGDAAQHPDDPKPLQILTELQQGGLPSPHRVASQNAVLTRHPLFSIALENDELREMTPDARTWQVNLNGEDWTLDLTLDQPTRSPMLVGGTGRTGLHRPDDMYYLSLTRMKTTGTLTQGGVVDTVTGTGWLDRQWGTSWAMQDNGWDWFGLQLDDGSDLIVYRVRDNRTGKTLRAEATLLAPDGTQSVDPAPVLTPASAGIAESTYVDPATHIAFPQAWTLQCPKIGLFLSTTSVFEQQTIPVLGIGDAIWEGVVNAHGTRNGKAIGGKGYMELVGYTPLVVNPPASPTAQLTPPVPAPTASTPGNGTKP